MNRLLHRDLETKKIFIGTFIVILGIVGLLWGPSIVSILALTVTGFIAFRYVYGPGSIKSLFSKPTAPIKNFLLYFFLNIVLSFVISFILQKVLQWNLEGNSATEAFQPLLFIVLPIMIMGEELFSIFFLSIFSNKFRLPLASLLSAILFALIHYSTYDNGNIIHTLGHILLLQGTARILFNQAAIKSNSLITSYAVHLIFDFTAIIVAFFFG
ncbi:MULTISPECIES: CPBP family glutamic-type intramembrane protease [unclassified Enterococcus]|uniref:CPBP family glutamic-type intramembrane protease n=1 Tax=unclassified Enterococcus TaxID=2608891 RepID=UPI003F1FC3AB